MTPIFPDLKRDIFDYYRVADIVWFGALSDIDFLARLYDLTTLPSTDPRSEDIRGDIWQHRVNNGDWDDWWIINDRRLDFDNDEKLARFICETIHPIVRPDTESALKIARDINTILESHGMPERLTEVRYLVGKPVFDFRTPVATTARVQIRKREATSVGAVQDQIEKCLEKLNRRDFEGAITNARTLVETVIGDIHEQVTGNRLPDSGDLTKDFKKVQRLLNLSAEQKSDLAAKGMVTSFVGVLSNLEAISNKMGDRHRALEKPQPHHAKLCVDIAFAATDFLYSTLEHLSGASTSLYEDLIGVLDSKLRSKPREELIQEHAIKRLLGRLDNYTCRLLIGRLLADFEIPTFSGFRRSDVFFAAMRIFLPYITQGDFDEIFAKYSGNDQAVGLPTFIKLVQETTSGIKLSSEMHKYLEAHAM